MPSPEPSQDWAFLLAQFNAEYVPLRRSLRQFVHDRGLVYSTTAKAFDRESKRGALGAFRARNAPLLLAAQENLKQVLIAAAADPKKYGDLAVRIYEKLAERVEPDPTLAAAANVKLPPLFGESSLGAQVTAELLESEPHGSVPKDADNANKGDSKTKAENGPSLNSVPHESVPIDPMAED